MNELELFERAFGDGGGSCRIQCNCGKTYFNDDESWTWEEGELEDLRKRKDAFPLDYCPGRMTFEGREYVDACDCWHKRAGQIEGFLNGHASKIAKYLTLQKQRLQAIADAAPVVKDKA